jgi:hypothetical protein
MSKKIIIGFNGFAKVGKDTFADALIRTARANNMSGIKIDLVQRLKEGLSAMFGVPFVWFTDQQFKDVPIKNTKGTNICSAVVGKTPRFLMQTLGTYITNYIDREYWIKSGCDTITHTVSQLCIITGIRRDSEAVYLKKQFPNSLVIRLTREDVDAINKDVTEIPLKNENIDMEIVLPDLYSPDLGYDKFVEMVYNQHLIK